MNLINEQAKYTFDHLHSIGAIPYSRVVKRTLLISAYSLLGAGLILLSKYFLLSASL